MNHLMTRGNGSPASLRDAHVADTRRRIVDAVADLLRDDHPASLSVPAVAQRAGVSVATVYRHFPSKEALLDAVSEVEEPVATPEELPRTRDELEAYLLGLCDHVEAAAPLVRAQVASPVGRDVRRRRLGRRMKLLAHAAETWGVDVESDEGRRLVRMLGTFLSSISMLDLLQHQGLSHEQVASDLTWAIEALVQMTRESQPQRTKPNATRSAR
jgi:AcrR family transcriptional regulator